MEITTDHLVLREFEGGDFEAMLAYQLDPRYLRYYPREEAERTPEDVRILLQKFLDDQQKQPRIAFQLAVALRDGGRLLGNVGVRMSDPSATEGEIGCEFAPEYWNLGYATEATRAMLAFGFEQLRLHRLWAWTIASNTGARRVLEKLGMKCEGELRETTLLADGWANSVIYGLLEQEWQAQQAAKQNR